MQNRQPFNLKYILIIYNLAQVYHNYWIIEQAVVEKTFWKYLFTFGCAEVNDNEKEHYNVLINRAYWNATTNKILDLFDTVFFILSKKQNHVTFLHVQHHVCSVLILWIAGKYVTGQEFTMTLFCNMIVHMIMYFYYFLAALGPQYKKYLWWKKYITLIQMIQFVLIISYMIASMWFSCGYNPIISMIIISNVALNLALFLNFYLKTYPTNLIEKKMMICGSLQYQFEQNSDNNNSKYSSEKDD